MQRKIGTFWPDAQEERRVAGRSDFDQNEQTKLLCDVSRLEMKDQKKEIIVNHHISRTISDHSMMVSLTNYIKQLFPKKKKNYIKQLQLLTTFS